MGFWMWKRASLVTGYHSNRVFYRTYNKNPLTSTISSSPLWNFCHRTHNRSALLCTTTANNQHTTIMDSSSELNRLRQSQPGTIIEEEAYEIHNPDVICGMMLTCEHASQRLPNGWVWHVEDAHLYNSHWAIDLGARELTIELAAHLSCCAYLCRFSRLLIDANRETWAETLIRSHAERGLPVMLNKELTEHDRQRRMEVCYEPYHNELERRIRSNVRPGGFIFSIHSFTEVYRPTDEPVPKREMVGGLLVDQEEALALKIQKALLAQGVDIRINEPYSGVKGLIDQMHTDETLASQYRYLALEVRQDLVLQPEWRSKMALAMAHALKELNLV
eukprot:TRINITY_DN1540_c0_g1_i2.p1 TRINITY_DN1540_c0_g1~~TRINITY_DN1540_c0_g1_i2.p1  ORF type:complete len:333 (-),score=36.27 TRINITY_DN1540_c0_g1_i2:283-1281(-)